MLTFDKKRKKRERERERAKVGDNNGQATHGARKHAWRTQAAWAKIRFMGSPEVGEKHGTEIEGKKTVLTVASFACNRHHRWRTPATWTFSPTLLVTNIKPFWIGWRQHYKGGCWLWLSSCWAATETNSYCETKLLYQCLMSWHFLTFSNYVLGILCNHKTIYWYRHLYWPLLTLTFALLVLSLFLSSTHIAFHPVLGYSGRWNFMGPHILA